MSDACQIIEAQLRLSDRNVGLDEWVMHVYTHDTYDNSSDSIPVWHWIPKSVAKEFYGTIAVCSTHLNGDIKSMRDASDSRIDRAIVCETCASAWLGDR